MDMDPDRIHTSGFLFDADADPDVDPGLQNDADPNFNGEYVIPVQRI
jgi:hypothetical protein